MRSILGEETGKDKVSPEKTLTNNSLNKVNDKNCARNSHKIMGFSSLCGTCGALGRMREYMGPELDQITHNRLWKFRSTHTLALSQTEHTILTEEPVQ